MKDPKTGAEYEQLYPKGDKRTIDFIIDAVDLIGYVKSNGYDEEGNPQMSSIYFQSCPEYLAGSRFKYMPSEITPFTAEGVQQAIADAVEQEEAESGVKAVTYSEKQSAETVPTMSYGEAMATVKPLFKRAVAKSKERTNEIVEKYLGAGNKISETNEKQVEQIIMIIDELEEFVDE